MPYRIKREVHFMRLKYLGNVTPKISGNCFLLEGDGCIEEANKVAVFGCGYDGFKASYFLDKLGIKIDCFLDNDEHLWGKKMLDKPIVSPYNVLESDDKEKWDIIVAVSPRARAEVRLQLLMYGIKKVSIFFMNDFYKFQNDELLKKVIDAINALCLERESVEIAVPYTSLCSGDISGKLGEINDMLLSTTWSHYVYEWLYDDINSNDKLLEIGPGYGLLTYTMLKKHEAVKFDWIIYGNSMEIKEDCYSYYYKKTIKQFPDNVDMHVCRIELDEIHNETKYDKIVLAEVFEHFASNPVGVMKKIANMLNVDGRIYVTTPNWRHLYCYKTWKELKYVNEISNEMYEIVRKLGHVYQYRKDELDEIFYESGLMIEKYEVSESGNHNVVLKKKLAI